jgi:uncharacterized membrane protein
VPYALALVIFGLYATLSVSRQLQLRTTGYDLGIFEQAVRGYAHLGPPVAELKGPGFDLLSDHFHPILALLAPVYRAVPDARTLLVAQAALLAVSVVPVTRLAVERLGRWPGLAVGAGYGLSSGLQAAVGFDFHEVCFAVPLLAFCTVALVREQWRTAALWALPLVLVKEDLPLTVAAIGGYLLLRRQFRLGAVLTAFGLVSYVVIVHVLMPRYAYTSSISLTSGLTGWDIKARTVAELLAPTALLAVRSPVALLAVPTLAWRFWSDNPAYWGIGFHYGAVLMPILAVSFVDRVPRRLVRAAPVLGLAATLALCSVLPLRDLVSPSYWARSGSAVRAALTTIPDGAAVAASNALAPQLTARCTVFLFPTYPTVDVRPEYVALLDPTDTTLFPASTMDAAAARLFGLGYRIIAHRDGVVIWRIGLPASTVDSEVDSIVDSSVDARGP